MQYISCLPGPLWQREWPRALAILGSTGSIGTSALAVVRQQPERFTVAALAGARNIPLLAEQAAEFRPPYLGILDDASVFELLRLLPSGYSPTILTGPQGYEVLARLPEASTILSAQVGAAGLRATMAAAQAGKVIALANKESLVLAGHLIRAACAASGASILPVDSEHNAIFQCLSDSFAQSARQDERQGTLANMGKGSRAGASNSTGTPCSVPALPDVSRLILTASGGPFRGKSKEELARVTLEQALAHPNWSMGAKITIDSATLMNKGLEIIEAQHLYGLPLADIDVVVHKESIVHSLVEYTDGSQLAHMGTPDMRIAIAHCLGWPDRLQTGTARLDLAALGSLTFTRPDEACFPCLPLARQAQEAGGGSPVVLNAANEVAVAAFLERRISYLDIASIVEQSLEWHAGNPPAAHAVDSLEVILALDTETRRKAQEFL